MGTKHDSVIGKSLEEFQDLFSAKNGVHKRRARLIPTYKPGDEMALTSVLLASLRLVKEFREDLFASAKIAKGSTLLIYTEVSFKDFGKQRLDGLLLVARAGTIRDAAILEMKTGTDCLEEAQVDGYLAIARKYSIPRIITVSNQFTGSCQQTPLKMKQPKDVALYHFSWSYILTIAHILLCKNDRNIDDIDQVHIMREVVYYFENEKSGVRGFTQMQPGWKSTIEKINAGATLARGDAGLSEAVDSWVQEEQDLALMMSRELGILVETGGKRKVSDLCARIDAETASVIKSREFESTFRVGGAASDIYAKANLGRRNVELKVVLEAPAGKTLKGQVGWIRKQLKLCEQKEAKAYAAVERELCVQIRLKHQQPQTIMLGDLEDFVQRNKGSVIKEFGLAQVKDLGKAFANPKRFVQTLEVMMITYYQGLVQHLRRWEAPAPKLGASEAVDLDDQNDDEDVSDVATVPEIQEQPHTDGQGDHLDSAVTLGEHEESQPGGGPGCSSTAVG